MLGRARGGLSYANVVASLALFVALGGVSYATVTLPRNSVGTRALKNGAVTGPKIARNAIDGSKVRAHSLTGANIALQTLGKVPTASAADTAARASVADDATHAGAADSATNAATLGGLPSSAFLQASMLQRSGIVKFSSGTQTLLSKGPFSITATCSAGPIIEVDANSTESGALMFFGGNGSSAVDVTPGVPRNMGATSATDSIAYSLASPSGASLTGYVAEGVNILGSTCAALATGVG